MWVLIIVLVVVVLLVLFLVSAYNGLVKNKNQVESAWAQIDVQLKRRLDLIPNLVETVKGYAAHEKETLEGVIAARNKAMTASTVADQAAADNMITGALNKLFALQEAYPDLKANQNFLNLQEELTGTEGRIAYARQFYNDTVQKYNTKIQTFPTVVIAGVFHFTQREYFEIEETARETPQVSFDTAPPVAMPQNPANPPAPPAQPQP
jgi:LemA protein